MAINMEREKKRQEGLKSKGSGKYWKCQDGPNVIRVLPFQHKVTKGDIEEKLYEKGDLGKVFTEWTYPLTMQFGLNPENRKIPVMSTPETLAMYKKLKDSKDEDDQERAKKIRPSKKYAMNIIDINDGEKGVQIFLAAKSVREFVGDHVIDPDFGEAILGAKGRDIKIVYNSKAEDAKGYYKLFLQDKEKSRPISSKVCDGVFDLYDPKINEGFASRKDASELDAGEESAPADDLEGEEKPKAASNGKKKDIFDD